MNGAAQPLIELGRVDVSHADVPGTVWVCGVDWRIGRGEFWVVGGRSASGKTSLLLTAAGLNRPAGGTLRIFGRDLAEATEKEQIGWRHRIGFVFECGGRLFNHLTVAQNIALPLQYRLNDRAVQPRVDELLALLELQDYTHRLPSRLNLGIQQRVALARTLSSGAEVLFLDNPLSPLSVSDARWWLDFLGKLRETQRAKGEPMAFVASADDFRGWLDVASHFATVEDRHFDVIGGRDQLAASQQPIVREFLTSGV